MLGGDCDRVVMVPSGTAALEMAALLAEFNAGDEVGVDIVLCIYTYCALLYFHHVSTHWHLLILSLTSSHAPSQHTLFYTPYHTPTLSHTHTLSHPLNTGDHAILHLLLHRQRLCVARRGARVCGHSSGHFEHR